MNQDQPVPQILFLQLFQHRTSRITGTGILWAGCPSCDPTVSVKALRKHKALTPTSCLASPCLHPPPTPYAISQTPVSTICYVTTLFMVALCNRAGHIYFHPVVSSSFFLLLFFSSPNLSGRRLDVYHTSTHGVALV